MSQPVSDPVELGSASALMREMRQAVRSVELSTRLGYVRTLRGLTIEAEGPRTEVGELCAIVRSTTFDRATLRRQLLEEVRPDEPGPVLAEVVAVGASHVTLLPYGSTDGLTVGCTVVALGTNTDVRVGDALLGRVIDGFGRPLDGGPPPALTRRSPLKGAQLNPMRRPRIDTRLDTGVRCIDGLLTLGQGQRVGIFAGSGVGKSTLLAMIARHVKADVNVIAMIGERGREVREFIDNQLGELGLRRSVVVVASADQPALSRIRAAHAAIAIAEDFRAQGQQVLLTMDSITRLAMARREVGLSAGEPPTARGYTPSVFAELPQLCERCGTSPSGGSITALMTVLVDGDDLNEPVSDALRAILDGHIVLSRDIAHQGQYPAIDVLKSASRLLTELNGKEEVQLIQQTVRVIALLERNRQVVELGAYEAGSNAELDAALTTQALLRDWLRQAEGGCDREQTMKGLSEWHGAMRRARANSTSAASPALKATQPRAATRKPS